MLNKIGATGLLLIIGFLTFVYINFTEQQINQYLHFTKLAFVILGCILLSTFLAFKGCSKWDLENDDAVSAEERRQYYVNQSDWNLDSHRLGGIGESYYP